MGGKIEETGTAYYDLPAAKQIPEYRLVLKHGKLYADKACVDDAWAESSKKDHALELLIP